MSRLTLDALRGIDWRPKPGDGALWAIGLGHAGTHWYLGAFSVIMPFFKNDLGLSNTELGLLLGLRAITSTIVNMPAGALVDMIGRRGVVMAVALAWCGLPYFFIGLSDNFAVIAAALAVVGVSNNLWHPAAMSTLSEQYADRRGFAFSVHSMGASVGDALAPAVVGALVEFFGWRQVVVANVLPGVALAIVIWLLLRGARSGAPAAKSRSMTLKDYVAGIGELARNSQLMLLSLLSGVRALTQQGLSFVLPLFLANGLGLGPGLVGLYLALIQGAGVIASPVSGLLSDQSGRKPVVMAGMMATTVLVLLLIVVNSGPLFAVVLGLLGFFLFAIRPVLFAWTMESTPSTMGGTTIGILFGAQAFFGIFAPLVCGWLMDVNNNDMTAVFYFIAATVLVGNALTAIIPERSAQTTETTA